MITEKRSKTTIGYLYTLGIDGCRDGWIVAQCTPLFSISLFYASNIFDCKSLFSSSLLTLIDMPIGLPDSSSGRACDSKARSLLGHPRSASIFTPPSRAALARKNYHEGLIEERKRYGKGFSKQAWNLGPKILEVESFHQIYPTIPIRESHPELCFMGLGGRETIAHSKKTEDGIRARTALLNSFVKKIPESPKILAFPEKEKKIKWKHDDVLDALILALSAMWIHNAPETECILKGETSHPSIRFAYKECVRKPQK